MPSNLVTQFISSIEGPYKWFVLVVVASILSAFFTRFLFKTIKWIIIAAIIVGISLWVIIYLKAKITPIKPVRDLGKVIESSIDQ